jgi:hypothetical protein
LQRAEVIFDDGSLVARLRPLVAVSAERQAPDSLPHLILHCRESLGPCSPNSVQLGVAAIDGWLSLWG